MIISLGARLPAAKVQDIGEEDRLLSRLEGEMTVSSDEHADFTMSILDKGNGKAMLRCFP